MAQQGVLVSYKGETMLTAASSGNLPLCVLLWGMGAAKQLNLLRAVDEQGNTPFHHAVRAQSTDVMAFFNQQSKGMLTPELRLVDAVNTAGETGLQRAAATGCMPVIKALLDEKSDVCHVNNYGQNVLHICVRECQLWTLNYLHHYISDTVGAEKAKEMLHAVDKDGNGLIEYAADAGDVNITEYLVRKGLNPFRVHPDTGSTPLHLAVAHHRMELMSFLLHCGANPHIADKKGVTAFQHHALQQDPVLRAALMSHPRVTSCCTQAKVEYPTFDPEKGEGGVALGKSGRSFAIECKIRSNFLYLGLYGLVICGFLLLPIVVPFWVYFPLMAAVAYGYKMLSGKVSSLKKRASHARGRIILDPFQEILGAQEKFPGLWLGSFLACVVFCFMCMAYDAGDDEDKSRWDTVGVDSIEEEPILFSLSLGLVTITFITWALMVLFPPSPGLVDTRQCDFGPIMEKSQELGGVAPDASLYCRTSLVKKPVRSKFCSTSGFVVARFDHYCVWLNTAVGYGNHRVFMVFLSTHVAANICFLTMLIKALIRANNKTGPAFVLGTLLSQSYFFVFFLLSYVIVITCGLTFLLVEQCSNIVRNVTTNERINRSRYAWMKGPDGRPFNRFDKGVIANVLDFFLVPGFAVDYTTIMEIPEAVKKSKSVTSTTVETSGTASSPTMNALHADNGHDHSHSHDHGHEKCGHDHDRHL